MRVEGHTSKGWGSIQEEDKAYLLNMKLSQDRACNVLDYCYWLDGFNAVSNKKWLQKKLRANGMSYSNLLYKDKSTKEIDSNRSRRVEFKVLAKDK